MTNIYITLGYLIDAVILIKYGISLFPFKTDNARKNTISIFLVKLFATVMLLPINKYFTLKIPIIFGCCFLIFSHFFDAKKSHILLSLILYGFYGMAGEFLNSLISLYILHMDFNVIMSIPALCIQSVLLVYSIIALLCTLTVLAVNKHKQAALNTEYLTIFIIIFLFICSMNFYSIILSLYQYNNIPFINMSIITFLSCIIDFIFLYKHIMLQNKQAVEKTFIEQQVRFQRQHYEDLQLKYADIKKLQHNFKNHLQTIRTLSTIHTHDKMQTYISDLSDKLKKTDCTIFCGNPAVDSVLYNKIQHSQNYGIDLQISSVMLDGINVPDMDLCSIVCNLLDNAIECCEKEDDNKYIIFNIYKKAAYLVFECRNHCGEYSPETKKSNRNIHGWGLKIIKSTAEKYNGNNSVLFKDNEFIHIVNICI